MALATSGLATKSRGSPCLHRRAEIHQDPGNRAVHLRDRLSGVVGVPIHRAGGLNGQRSRSSYGPARPAGAPFVPVAPRTAPVRNRLGLLGCCPPPASSFHRLTGRRPMPPRERPASTRLYWMAGLESPTVLSAYRKCPLFLNAKSLLQESFVRRRIRRRTVKFAMGD